MWIVEGLTSDGARLRIWGDDPARLDSRIDLMSLRAETPVWVVMKPDCTFGEIGAKIGTYPALLRLESTVDLG